MGLTPGPHGVLMSTTVEQAISSSDMKAPAPVQTRRS
jgi:hypothetical protein